MRRAHRGATPRLGAGDVGLRAAPVDVLRRTLTFLMRVRAGVCVYLLCVYGPVSIVMAEGVSINRTHYLPEVRSMSAINAAAAPRGAVCRPHNVRALPFENVCGCNTQAPSAGVETHTPR